MKYPKNKTRKPRKNIRKHTRKNLWKEGSINDFISSSKKTKSVLKQLDKLKLFDIKDQLQLPEMLSGDVYSAGHLPLVPQNMRAAVAEFSQSEFAKAAFGGEVVKHYAHFFEQEIQSYEKTVTDWERARYFERI